MSWSLYTVGTPDEIKDRIAALTPPGDSFTPRDDQVNAAKAAAQAIIDSGAVGAGDAYSVSLAGHANPDHAATAGSANDTVAVSVSQVAAAAVTQFDQADAQQQRNLE